MIPLETFLGLTSISKDTSLFTASGIPPLLEPIIEIPDERASKITLPNPSSCVEGIIKVSANE